VKLEKFGDSYDIVKQSLLRWLAPCGPWRAHPMFTEPVDSSETTAFSEFLGVELLSTAVLERATDRNAYFACAVTCPDHLFLDPNTGLRIPAARRAEAPDFVNGTELVTIARNRPNTLTLVFDQSIDRRHSRHKQIEAKLSWLAKHKVYGVVYESHACFVLVSATQLLLEKALQILTKESSLPPWRFVMTREKPQNNHRQQAKAAQAVEPCR